MIVIDTSAVLAILFEEPEAEAFMTRIVEAESPAMSAVSVLEAGLVMAGRGGGPAQWTLFDALLQDARDRSACSIRRSARAALTCSAVMIMSDIYRD